MQLIIIAHLPIDSQGLKLPEIHQQTAPDMADRLICTCPYFK